MLELAENWGGGRMGDHVYTSWRKFEVCIRVFQISMIEWEEDPID
jgi:hypothetical protein